MNAHPTSRAERLRIKEIKYAKKRSIQKEEREQRLLKKALLSKEAKDGPEGLYEGDIQ